MTEFGYPFDSGEGSDRTEDDWRLFGKATNAYGPGVLPGELNELLVYGDSTGMVVKVKTGVAGAFGTVYVNDGELSKTITANATGSTRWDLVVVNFDFVGNLIRVAVIPGTSDVAGPALEQDRTTLYQLPIAYVAVPNGAATIRSQDVYELRDRWLTDASSRLGVVEDFMFVHLPADAQLCYGQKVNWHYFPKLYKACVTATIPVTFAANGWGIDADNISFDFPDYRGRVGAGADNMGGIAAGLLGQSQLLGRRQGQTSFALDDARFMPALTWEDAFGAQQYVDEPTALVAWGDVNSLADIPAGAVFMPNKLYAQHVHDNTGGVQPLGWWGLFSSLAVAGDVLPPINAQEDISTQPPTIITNKIIRVC